jgi:hypothetical protein
MLDIFGKNYYIDVDEVIEKCRPSYSIKELEKQDNPLGTSEESSGGGLELNVFKFEVFKACIERILGEYEDVDDKLGAFAEHSASPSFKMAFNTLLKYEILIEDND